MRHGSTTLCALSLLSCGGPPVPTVADVPVESDGGSVDNPSDRPDLVVVLLGGLRTAPTPDFDPSAVLAKNAFSEVIPTIVYSSVYAQSVTPWLSLGSALTGRYVASMPLCSPPKGIDGPSPFCAQLPDGAPTIGEVLQLYGYRTGLVIVDHPDLAPLGKGFDTVVAPADADRQPWSGWYPAMQQAKAFWANPDPRPKLLVIVGRINDEDYQIRERHRSEARPASDGEIADQQRQNPLLTTRVGTHVPWPLPSPEVAGDGRRFFGAGAQYIGEQLAPLFRETSGAWTFLGGLHGASLGELQGSHTPEQLKMGTAEVLLDRTLRTTLWVRSPTPRAPSTVDEPVEVLDLIPTLAKLAHAVPPANLPGQDLLAGAASPDRPVYAEYGDMLALRQGPHFVVFRPQLHGVTSASPALTEALDRALPHPAQGRDPAPPNRLDEYPDWWMLHDVRADPMQAHPLPLVEGAGPFATAADALFVHRTGPAAPPVSTLSFEQVQALRQTGALHYW